MTHEFRDRCVPRAPPHAGAVEFMCRSEIHARGSVPRVMITEITPSLSPAMCGLGGRQQVRHMNFRCIVARALPLPRRGVAFSRRHLWDLTHGRGVSIHTPPPPALKKPANPGPKGSLFAEGAARFGGEGTTRGAGDAEIGLPPRPEGRGVRRWRL